MLSSQGMPSDGISIGTALFMVLVSALARLLAATMATSRFFGSAICVPMFTSIIVT